MPFIRGTDSETVREQYWITDQISAFQRTK